MIVVTKPYPIVVRHEEEEQFSNPANGELTAFPSLQEPYSINLSVVVPAYNEEERCMLLLLTHLLTKTHVLISFERLSGSHGLLEHY